MKSLLCLIYRGKISIQQISSAYKISEEIVNNFRFMIYEKELMLY
jgi:hypothetical protein